MPRPFQVELMKNFTVVRKIIVTCNRGLAPAIEQELIDLGYTPTRVFNTGVELEGTLKDCIRLNLNLRCASQIMFSISEFQCSHPEELYKSILRLPWESWLDESGYFTVHGNVSHPTIRSSMFANVKVKDAIVDRIRNATGRRPDSGAELLGAVVYLFWRGNTAEIFLDTSGETLARHGYRIHPGKAPMVEALAAGIILSSKWDRSGPFVNPMCGAGTIAIEAALIATGRAPGLMRSQYSFAHIKGYDPKWQIKQRDLLQSKIVEPPDLKIVASDIDKEAVKIARANAENAGIDKYIKFSVCDFADTVLPEVDPYKQSVVMFNPEYGERLGDESELVETYKRIGDFMKQKCGGYLGYVFTGNTELGKKIGLKTKRRIEFATAQLDCRLLEFELYTGTKYPKSVDPQSGSQPA
jgi:23S rRNA G2445 N2-methylase RlmL